jgi:hypothetical protein
MNDTFLQLKTLKSDIIYPQTHLNVFTYQQNKKFLARENWFVNCKQV